MSNNIYLANQKGPYKLGAYHDKDDVTLYGFDLRPSDWTSTTIYNLDQTYVMPTATNGFYYMVISPGISSGTEPTWPTVVDGTVDDGTVEWKAIAFNLMPISETVTVSTWAASDSVVTSSPTNTAISTQIQVDSVPSAVTSFTLTNHITKSNGEELDRTIKIKVNEQ